MKVHSTDNMKSTINIHTFECSDTDGLESCLSGMKIISTATPNLSIFDQL